MKHSSGVLVAVLGLALGCGGGGSISIDDAPAQLADATCGYSFRCCTSAEITMEYMGITSNGQPITTESQCDTAYTGLFQSLVLPEWQASISAGRMRFDGDALQACLDILDTADCGGVGGDPNLAAQCGPFLVPLVTDGSACSQSYECTGGLCGSDDTCGDLPTGGEDCELDCASGFYCAFDTDTGSSTCTALGSAGTSCEGNGECESNACEGSDSESMTCVATCTGA